MTCPQGDEEAFEKADGTLVNFLAAEGEFDAPFQPSEPPFFRFTEQVNGRGY